MDCGLTWSSFTTEFKSRCSFLLDAFSYVFDVFPLYHMRIIWLNWYFCLFYCGDYILTKIFLLVLDGNVFVNVCIESCWWNHLGLTQLFRPFLLLSIRGSMAFSPTIHWQMIVGFGHVFIVHVISFFQLTDLSYIWKPVFRTIHPCVCIWIILFYFRKLIVWIIIG